MIDALIHAIRPERVCFEPPDEPPLEGYEELLEEYEEAAEEPEEDMWNTTCDRCKAPAYRGLTKVVCSRGCVQEDEN